MTGRPPNPIRLTGPKYQPQQGPQWDFCCSKADVAIYGGQAFAGKTVALLLEAVRYSWHQNYTGIIFRRTTPEITRPGGLWGTASTVYSPNETGIVMTGKNRVSFPSGGALQFSHLEHIKDLDSHYGGQYLFLGFDELITFEKKMFFFLLTRNRPAMGCDIPAYCRATTNPDADSWVRPLLSWWIDPETGYPIKERSGVLRYFTVIEEDIDWVDEDWRGPKGERPRSFTFIPGSIEDNPIGRESQPNYESNLMAQDRVTRERLRYGNWNITYKGGMFNPDWFKIIPELPKDIKLVRYWDMAASEVKKGKNPDFTAGVSGGMYRGELYFADAREWRESPSKTEQKIQDCAKYDGTDVVIGIEEEKGSSGKFVTDYYQREVLRGYTVYPDPVTGEKTERARPWAALAEQGHCYLLKGPWNSTFIARCASFPAGKRDMTDAASGVYKLCATIDRVWPKYSYNNLKSVNLRWDKMIAGEVVVFVHMVMDKSFGIWGNCFLWGRKSGKLWVYSEFVHPHPIAEAVVVDIKIKAGVPLRRSENASTITVERVYGDDELWGEGKSVAKLLRQADAPLNVNRKLNDAGGTMIARQLIESGLLTVDSSCIETDQQYRGWCIKDGKPEEGYWLCKNLCGVATILRDMGELRFGEEREHEAYDPRNKAAKETLKRSMVPAQAAAKRPDDFLL